MTATHSSAAGFESPCLNSLPAAVYACDPQGRITFFNQRAVDLWGHIPDQETHRYCPAFRRYQHDGVELSTEQTAMASVLRLKTSIQGQAYIVERADGSRLKCLSNISPTWNANGEFTGAVNVIFEESIESLVLSSSDTQPLHPESDSVAEVFGTLAHMSHALRTPLTAIIGFAEILKNQNLPDTKRTDYVTRISRSGEQLLGVAEILLDLSRIESGQAPIKPEILLTTDLISSLNHSLPLRFKNKSLNFAFEIAIAEDFPNQIPADPNQIEKILSLLLECALKLQPATNESREMHVLFRAATGQSPQEISFLIQLSHEKDLESSRLANRFQSVNQLDALWWKVYGANGMGLYLCHRIARVLGGRLEVALSESLNERAFRLSIPSALSSAFEVHLVKDLSHSMQLQ